MKATIQKIQCLHPQGKHAPAIAVDTFYLIEKAILESFKKKEYLSFTDLMKEVKKYFSKNKASFNGSVDWFGITVKNHLEATGIIETFTDKGKKMNRLKK